jgi:hypothetical protein
MICKSWHLCIPPLLMLLDDIYPFIRARGLRVLIDILSKTPANVLQQTGLDEVFEDTVIPTLLFLPNTTPLEESLRVLKPAYLVLFKLGQVRFPTKSHQPNRMKFLDMIMRQGILQGFLHSRDNIAIVELLLTQLVTLIESMGIHAVKHLKVGILRPYRYLLTLIDHIVGLDSNFIKRPDGSFRSFTSRSPPKCR